MNSASNLSYKSLIFLHVPKAAGSTLHSIIERQYSKAATFHVEGNNVSRSIGEFRNLSAPRRETIKCLKGHMPYGLHSYLAQPCTYITCLRDPVDRIISHYHFVLRTPNHYLHERIVSQRITLDEYVSRGISYELSNAQTRLLAGQAKGDLQADALDRAKKNLSHDFAVIGLAERFDESLILMKRRLGWRHVYYRSKKVAPYSPAKSNVPAPTIRLIKKANEKDLELYTFAKHLFEASIEAEGPSFEFEVPIFRLLNSVYRFSRAGLDRLSFKNRGT